MSDLNKILDKVISIGKTKKYSIKLVNDENNQEVFFMDTEKNCYAHELNVGLRNLLPNPNSPELFLNLFRSPIKTLSYIYYHAEMVRRGF